MNQKRWVFFTMLFFGVGTINFIKASDALQRLRAKNSQRVLASLRQRNAERVAASLAAASAPSPAAAAVPAGPAAAMPASAARGEAGPKTLMEAAMQLNVNPKDVERRKVFARKFEEEYKKAGADKAELICSVLNEPEGKLSAETKSAAGDIAKPIEDANK